MSISVPTSQNLNTVNTANGITQPNLPSGHASLYVGDLDEDVTEAMVYEKFSQVGQVLSIRVCRDMISRKSLGYAYVNFATTAEAEKAIDNLNFEVLRHRQMRIMWSQRDPSLRKSGVGNLFIKNLDKSIQVRDLYDTFSTFGSILSCKIATDEKGNSKGFGFLHFASKEAADTAVKKLNGMLLKDKKIFVGPFLPRNQRTNQGSSETNFNNVFVKNFGDDLDDDRLKKMFAQYGEITSHIVMKNDEGASRGFGFVCFKEPKDALAAVAGINGSDYNGRPLYCGRAMKKSERTEFLRQQLDKKKADKSARYAVGVNLYVKNLDDSIDEDTLRKEFSQHGNITSVKVMREASGRSKGFGFVCFSYPDEATKAVTEMSGKLVGGKPLYVALAQRKEERRLHLQGQHARQFMRGPVPHFPTAGIPPNAINPQAFAPPGLNVLFSNGYPGNQNPGLPPGSAFYGFPRSFMTPNMHLPPRQRWSAGPAPGGPQPPMVRSMGPVSNMQPGLMRPGAQTIQQTPRFPSNVPIQNHAPTVTNTVRPSVGQSQQRVMPGTMNVNSGAIRAGQVQFSMAARNLQPSVNTPQGRPVSDSSNPPSVQQSNETVKPLHTIPIEEFVQIVQSRTGNDQKQALGEKLYSIVKEWYPQTVGKLTGMLLEIENRELMAMILEHYKNPNQENKSSLRLKCDSASQVLATSQSGVEKRDSDSKKPTD